MSNNQIDKPNLRTYLNIHFYLRDVYQYRKMTEAGFSYEAWAHEIGVKNRSFLRQMVVGRRTLTDGVLKSLCNHFDFNEKDSEYFHLLALYSRSKNQVQKNMYGRKLMQLLKTEYEQSEVQNYYEFLSNPLLPKILTTLSFKDIPRTSKSLALILDVSLEKVEESLSTLERIGLASTDSTGWVSNKKAFKVPDALGSELVLDYHATALQEAISARSLPVNERRYKSLLVPLGPEEFKEFVEDLQDFTHQVLKKYDVDDLRSRRLFQINFNIHAISCDPAEVELPSMSTQE